MQREPARFAIALAVALVTVALVAGCSSGLKRPTVTSVLTPDSSGVQHVTVDLHSFWFEPNRIVVHRGLPVELTLHNHAVWVPHNFSIAAPGLQVNEGTWLGKAHVRFTPMEPDTFTFFCHVDGHAKKGMTGTLIVLP